MSLPPDLNCKPQLAQQIAFILEVDKVKHILRKSKLFDGSRFENDAEHSWTICMMAMLLRE
jgi:putative hydrolase of HD superfamily